MCLTELVNYTATKDGRGTCLTKTRHRAGSRRRNTRFCSRLQYVTRCGSYAMRVPSSTTSTSTSGGRRLVNRLLDGSTIDRLRHGAYQLMLDGDSYRAPQASDAALPRLGVNCSDAGLADGAETAD